MVRRPESFDEDAALYDRARPRYPPDLIDDLVAVTGVRPGDRVLEIGAGTGQMTLSLARRGLAITALEPGPNLAAIARRHLAPFPAVDVVGERFEDYVLPAEPFELVVSATAFHWVDPAVRVRKAAAALVAGGHLAVVHTHWGVGRTRDPFSVMSQSCYRRWEPDSDPDFRPPTIDELPVERPELDDAPEFTAVERRLYEQRADHTRDSYLDLLRTFSNVRGLDEAQRSGLLACIGRLIDTSFVGVGSRSPTSVSCGWPPRRLTP